jgi:hypothetical protein
VLLLVMTSPWQMWLPKRNRMDWFMMGISPPPALLCQKVSMVIDHIHILGEPQCRFLFILNRIITLVLVAEQLNPNTAQNHN